MMGIDEYERRLPNWKELVSIHDAESIRILKEKRGNYGAQHISLALDEALERLEQRRRAADAAAGRESRDAEEGRGTRDERRGAATPDAGQETSGEERWPKAATEFLPRPSSPYFDARQWAEPMMRQRRDSAAAAPPPPSAAAAEGRRQPDEGSGAQQRDEGQGDARGL